MLHAHIIYNPKRNVNYNVLSTIIHSNWCIRLALEIARELYVLIKA